MKAICKAVLPLSLIYFLAINPVSAQSFKNEFGFKSDNDSYLMQGSDRYYTNGLFINFRHALNQTELPEKLEKKIFEISAGQKIYNPYSGSAPDPAKQDRPFAGYLYAEGGLNWFYKNESIIKTSVQVGVTGPSSLAEKGQDLLHNTVGFYELGGWDYQIKEEMQVNLSAQYTRLLHRFKDQAADFSFEGYANVGTTFSGAGAGILFRAGRINQLFNSAATNSVIGNQPKTKNLVKSELFFYAKPQLNFVAYDATIQGSMFNNNSPVTFGVKPVVFAQQLGFNYSSQRFTFDFGMIFKTKEVKSTARAHQYGSISMFYRFN
ncbi:lipid A deacylase LpxR family protein [Pedobacter sp. PLR]|uniref:lipid A deacylase LpxR family protein n=1 Tax=Pedobacter sp. PLR TaxID=2994465 RepID=UPI002247A35C|nr:lipid A deacylase LpxR family protein [Pedobacter sp. PLR]MCX2451748.1 lipid A deacylase LpxR family protein [Pedobacter sp. PLR]